MLSFKRYLYEMAINVPPHLPRRWYEQTLSSAEKIEKKAEGIAELIEKAMDYEREVSSLAPFREVWDIAPYNLRKTFAKKDSYGWTDPISERIKSFFSIAKIEGIRNADVKASRNRIDVADQWEEGRWKVDDFVNKYQELFGPDGEYDELMQAVEEDKKYFEPGDYDKFKATFKAAKEKLSAVTEYAQLAQKIKKAIAAFKEREEINLKAAFHWGDAEKDSDAWPAHENVETLYHGTTHLREVLSQGFKTQDELGGVQKGLGGAVEGISFTADVEIAKAISDALKEVINIANGKLKMWHILQMLDREGIDIRDRDSFGGWLDDYKSFNYRRRRVGKPDPNRWGEPIKANYGVMGDPKQHVFELYRRYLMTSKMRYDPYFFNVTYKHFEGLDPNNVGVVAADVQMNQVHRYLKTMEEFRVPVQALSNIRQVY